MQGADFAPTFMNGSFLATKYTKTYVGVYAQLVVFVNRTVHDAFTGRNEPKTLPLYATS